ncbi:MAG: AI-2E family transporter [Microbacteriaceae bacterium]|nr:AI-2E family transporter [Microbacteriaceae bacterium]
MFRKLFGSKPSTASRVAWEVAAPKSEQVWEDDFGRFATRALQVIIVIVLLALVVLAMGYIGNLVIPALLAIILASTLTPIVGWLRGLGVPRFLAAWLVMAASIGAFFGVLGLIAWTIHAQFDEIVDKAVRGYEQIIAWLRSLGVTIDEQSLKQAQEKVAETLFNEEVGGSVLQGAVAFGNGLGAVGLIGVLFFFFLSEGDRIWEFLCRPWRGAAYLRAKRVGESVVTAFGAYVRGTAALALANALIITVPLLILQVPLVLPLAALVFLLSFIPIVGALIAGAFAALVALVTSGPVAALVVVAVVIIINQLEGALWQPLLMGRAVKLHQFVVLLSITVGTILGGLFGSVIAVPIVAAFWGAVRVWNGPNTPARWAQEKDPAEVKAYELIAEKSPELEQ